MNTQWIKTSDRAPTEAESPVWVYDSNVPNGAPLKGPMLLMCCPSAEAWSHWRPAKADIPEPPREETQEQKDTQAWAFWRDEASGPTSGEAWHAALAYEREQVAKMLPGLHYDGDLPAIYRAIDAIRARCEGRTS